MSDHPSPLPEDEVEQLRLLVQRLARRIRNNRGDDTLSDTQIVVLFHLERDETLAPVELAKFERLSPPSMNRTLNALQERGLVRRAPSPDDARRVDVTLTDDGRALLRATRQLRSAWLVENLARLTPEEHRALMAALPALRRLTET